MVNPSGRGQNPRNFVPQAAAAIGGSEHFAQDTSGTLYRFSNGVYLPDGAEFLRQRFKHYLEDLGLQEGWSSHKANELVEYLRIDAPFLWERPPSEVVNVLNGLLNVETGLLEPHRPDFLSTVQLPVYFDASATCPKWHRFVSQVFPGDMGALAWELVGWLMTPDTSMQKAVLLVGPGGNGKSTLLGAIRSFLGSGNTSSRSLQRLETDRFAVAQLVGRLANVCSDIPSTRLVETSIFKAITGGDTVTGEHKFREAFNFRPFARLVFSANDLPSVNDQSMAFWGRWVVLPFTRVFRGTGAERPLGELLAELTSPEELSGLLNMALEGLRRLKAQNGFTVTDGMREALEAFRQENDPIGAWLDTETVLAADAWTAKAVLLAAYNEYQEGNDPPMVSANAFGRAMKRHRPTVKGQQRTVAGAKVWGWQGIRLGQPEPLSSPPARDEPAELEELESPEFSHPIPITTSIPDSPQNYRGTGVREERERDRENGVISVLPVLQDEDSSVQGSLRNHEEWRRISVPNWQRIFKEATEQGDSRRAEYARRMLQDVLQAS